MEIELTKNQDNLKEAIVEAIAFFDMFDYPLTEMEIWRFVNVGCELTDIQLLFANQDLKNVLENENGFYFLRGRQEIIATRHRRYNYANRKFKRAIWLAKIFKVIPWIKMIAIGNLMGFNNLKDKSDIDLFIITQERRLWLTRLFCVIITQFLGWRPTASNTRDKICLSFFVSENALDLRPLMLDHQSPLPPFDKGVSKDVYFVYWLAGLVPIYDADNNYQKLIIANKWLNETLPNWKIIISLKSWMAGRSQPKIYRLCFDWLFGHLEPVVEKWQMKIMPLTIKELMNKDTRVVIGDDIIKMHVNDRREEYLKKFQNLNVKFPIKLKYPNDKS